MSRLLDDARLGSIARPTGSNRPPGSVRPPGSSPIVAGLVAAAQAAGASLTVVLVPVILTWATAAYSHASWSQALEVGADIWLLAHRAGIAIPGGQVGLVPIGLLLVPLSCCWLAGVRIARTLDPHAEAIRAGAQGGRAGPSLPPVLALAVMVGGYTGVAALACVLGSTATVRPHPVSAVLGALVLSAVGAVSGAATWAARGRRAGLRLLLGRLRLPRIVLEQLPVAFLAVTLQLGAGLLLLVTALVTGHDRVALLHSSLAPGLLGGVVLSLAQAAAGPNLAIWAAAYAAGPGFAVGTGTAVRPTEVRLGPLPAVPVLGALPDRPLPALAVWLLPLVGVVAGAAAGFWLAGRADGTPGQVDGRADGQVDGQVDGRDDVRAGWLDLLARVATAAGLVGLTWLLLGWLAGGPAGPGRLGAVGPEPWLLAAAVTVEVGAGLLVGAGARTALGALRRRHLSAS